MDIVGLERSDMILDNNKLIIPLGSDEEWWKVKQLPDDYKFTYKYEVEEEKMNELLSKYHKVNMSAEIATAYELGAMDEWGALTPDGIELLVEIFNDNEEMQKIFFDILDDMLECECSNSDNKLLCQNSKEEKKSAKRK